MSKEPNIEDVLNTFIDKIKAGVVVHDNNTKLIRCNKKSLNLLGLTEKQLIGKAKDYGMRILGRKRYAS